jgi:hypothetical protein
MPKMQKNNLKNRKLCPLSIRPRLFGKPQINECLGDKCALWIRLEQPANTFKLTYEGCGLVSIVPFEVQRTKEQNYAA